MAQIKKTRKNLQIKRGKTYISGDPSRYVYETFKEILERAEFQIRTYDNLMENAYKKRVGTSEFERLLRLSAKNIEYVIQEIRNKLTNNKNKLSQDEIMQAYQILGELTRIMTDKPNDYREACLIGQIKVMRSKMESTHKEWTKTKSQVVTLQNSLVGLNKTAALDSANKASVLIDASESEVNSVLTEATALEDTIVERRHKKDAELLQVATNAGYRTQGSELDKENLINTLTEYLKNTMNNQRRMDYRIVIETIKALKREDDAYDCIFRNLLIDDLDDIGRMREEIRDRIVLLDRNIGFVITTDDTLLASIETLTTTMGGTVESPEIFVALEEEKLDTVKKLGVLERFTQRASKALNRILTALGMDREYYMKDEVAKRFYNKPKDEDND